MMILPRSQPIDQEFSTQNIARSLLILQVFVVCIGLAFASESDFVPALYFTLISVCWKLQLYLLFITTYFVFALKEVSYMIIEFPNPDCFIEFRLNLGAESLVILGNKNHLPTLVPFIQKLRQVLKVKDVFQVLGILTENTTTLGNKTSNETASSDPSIECLGIIKAHNVTLDLLQ